MAHGFHVGSSLSMHRAFVVHFGAPGGSRRRFHGRVEHLASGRTTQFSSLKALLAFLVMELEGLEPAPPRSPIDRTRAEITPAGTRASRTRPGRTGGAAR